MESRFWGSHKRRSRGPREEDYNREGHWTRTFTVRTESWPIVEHWCTEHKFRLIATKGRRRLYQQGFTTARYSTFFDIRHEETSIQITVWIRAGWQIRLLTLFRVPSDMPLEPRGFWGVIKRRKVCREVNALLGRFKQAPIMDSERFHPGDIDATTLALFFSFFIPIFTFVTATVPKFEMKSGLSNPLLISMGKPFGILLGVGACLLVVHHYAFAMRMKELLWKAVSAGGAFLLFAVFATVLLTQTRTEMTLTKLTYHCLHSFDQAGCGEALDEIPEKNRGAVIEKVRFLEKELVRRNTPSH